MSAARERAARPARGGDGGPGAAGAHPAGRGMHPLLRVQRAAGNRAAGALVQRAGGEGAPASLRSAWGLAVSQPGDAAERAADQASRRALEGATAPGAAVPLRHPAARAGVPDGGGEPLPAAARAEFERRFGADLSAVRLHTGTMAAGAARSVSALAYAAGRNVVWGAQAPPPWSSAGRRLLAHELAHVVQQGEEGRAAVQRTCTPAMMCPILTVSLGGSGFNWEAAEVCLQMKYPFKGVVGSNRDWRFLTAPAGSAEQRDLDCFKSHLVARSGMFLSQPDIIDFTRAEIYDVTTVGQAGPHRVRMWSDVGLATSLAANPDCSGTSRAWTPGTWNPPSCWWLGGDLYMLVVNENGLLLYDIIKDISKELAASAILAAMIAASRNQIKKKLATAAATRVPHVAAALAAVMVVVLVTTDAEASFGGDGDPIEGLIKALENADSKVPEEIKEALRNDPDLRAKIEAAAKEADPSERAKKLSQGCLEVIARNKDKFSREELEALTTMVQAAGDDKLPGKTPTVEALKQQAERIRKGEVTDPGAGDGAPAPGPTADAPPPGADSTTADIEKEAAAARPGLNPETVRKIAAAPDLARRLLDEVAGRAGAGKPLSDADVERLLAAVPRDLTQAQFDAVRAKLTAGTTQEPAELLANLEKHIAAAQKQKQAQTAAELAKKHPALSPASLEKLAKASPAARGLLAAVAESGLAGVALTDAAVDRFLAIMGDAVTPEQVQAVAARLTAVTPADTIDSVLASLQKAVADAAKAKPPGTGGSEKGAGGTEAKGPGTKGEKGGTTQATPEGMLLARMLVLLAPKVATGESRLEWKGKRPVTGTVKKGALFFGKAADGSAYIARVTGLVHQRGGAQGHVPGHGGHSALRPERRRGDAGDAAGEPGAYPHDGPARRDEVTLRYHVGG